jgi:hypothetical protein
MRPWPVALALLPALSSAVPILDEDFDAKIQMGEQMAGRANAEMRMHMASDMEEDAERETIHGRLLRRGGGGGFLVFCFGEGCEGFWMVLGIVVGVLSVLGVLKSMFSGQATPPEQEIEQQVPRDRPLRIHKPTKDSRVGITLNGVGGPPMVTAVSQEGLAYRLVFPGDVLLSVNGVAATGHQQATCARPCVRPSNILDPPASPTRDRLEHSLPTHPIGAELSSSVRSATSNWASVAGRQSSRQRRPGERRMGPSERPWRRQRRRRERRN